MSIDKNPHDKYFKLVLNDLHLIERFLDHQLNDDVKSIISFDTLKKENDSFINEAFKNVFTDTVYSVKTKDFSNTVYFLIEHQSTSKKNMPLRMYQYTVEIITNHIETYKASTLPLVIPLVFYTGRSGYYHSNDIYDMYDYHKDLAKGYVFQPFSLIQNNRFSDYNFVSEQKLHLFYYFMNIVDEDITDRIERVACHLNDLYNDKCEEHFVVMTLKYAIHNNTVPDIDRLVTLLSEKISTNLEGEMLTYGEELIMQGEAKGETKGIAKGIAKGVIKGKLDVALKLVKKGFSINEVAELTELSNDEIEDHILSEV